MKRKLSPQIHGPPITTHQVVTSSGLQAPLAPIPASPTPDIPKHKQIRKASTGIFKETARRILSTESSMSTTLVSNSPGQRYPCPDDSAVIGKAANDLHVEEEVEEDSEEKTDEGRGQEMEFLEKKTAETARESLTEDQLYTPLSKAPRKTIDPFLGTCLNESPAISQQKNIPATKDPSSLTSADQVPLAPKLITPIDPSKSSMNGSLAISLEKYTQATEGPASPPSLDQAALHNLNPPIGPSKSSVNDSPAISQPKTTPAAEDPSSLTFVDQLIPPIDPSNSSIPFDPMVFFQDLQNFLELESSSAGFQLSSSNPAMAELSEEDFNKHVSTIKNLIAFSLEAISHPGRHPVLLSTCKALLGSTRLPSHQALCLQQLVNTLPYLIQRYEVASRELSQVEKVLQDKEALLKELRDSFQSSKEYTKRRSAIMTRQQEIEEAIIDLLNEVEALKKEDSHLIEKLRSLAKKSATAISLYEEVKPQSENIMLKQSQVMAEIDLLEKQWSDFQENIAL